MRQWLSSIVLIVTGAFAVASGCGNPNVVNDSKCLGTLVAGQCVAGTPDASAGGTGGGGGFTIGNGGDDTNGCPASCAELNADCGYVTDIKCGGVIQCGTCSVDGEVCGGVTPNRCGNPGNAPPPDAGTCTPSSCDELNANCGFATDTKCGGVVQCGTCTGDQTCGLGGPNQCGVGDAGSCTPATCDSLGFTCGQAGDGCGHLLDCGSTTCPNPGETCQNGSCKGPVACVPTVTCQTLGYSCGKAADNCGTMLDCGSGTCPIPGQTCGGGLDQAGNPILGVCGCTGACKQIPTCSTGTTTTLSGKVYDPAGLNPLYHVLVYVANNPADPDLKTFPVGLTCDVCGSSAAGSPLVSTPGATDPPAGEYSGVDGSFTLKNVPTGNVTLVIQLGRWRRTFPINVANSCAANPIPDKTLLMPSKQTDGNIPLMAMVTGNADSLECVLRKMGIDRSEFTNPAQNGRVQFYTGTGNAGQTIDGNTPTQDALFATANGAPVINGYDMTILSCQGSAYAETTANQAALRSYADHGGRVFTTHYSYTWLYQNNASTAAPVGTADNWSEVAKWHVDENDRNPGPLPGIIDKVSNPKGAAFLGWLEAVNATQPNPSGVPGADPVANVIVIRHDTDLISTTPGQTQQWLYRDGDDARLCSVSGGSCATTACTPKVCSVRTQQACTADTDCTAKVCSNRTQTSCASDNDCRFAGNNGQCKANTCATNTCGGFNYKGTQVPLHFTFNTPVNLKEDLTTTPPAVQCGRVLFSDFHVQDATENGEVFPAQCGKTCTTDASCTTGNCKNGTCPWGTACTTDAQCASTCSGGRCLDPMNAQEKLLEFMIFDLGSCVPPPKTCVPKACSATDGSCGYVPDGCGGLAPCQPCPTGEQCGVGQPPVPNQCGKVTCAPAACPAAQECGYASDGCSGSVLCGTCPTGQTCTNGKCGSVSCTPKSCTDQDIECGKAGDQCGKQITCPTCPTGNSCIAGKCVPQACVPQTCDAQGIQCGQAADGCGNMIASCGNCPAGDLCLSGQCKPVN